MVAREGNRILQIPATILAQRERTAGEEQLWKEFSAWTEQALEAREDSLRRTRSSQGTSEGAIAPFRGRSTGSSVTVYSWPSSLEILPTKRRTLAMP